MKKLKKTVIGIIMCSITMLAGCSTATDNQLQDVLYQGNTKNIAFSWWGGDARNRYTLDAVDNFEKLNEDISVQCKYGVWAGYSRKQNIFMKSHDEPDVMMINYDWLSLYSSDGDGFYDMYQLSDDIELSNYTADELKYGEINGRLNAIPIAFNTQTFYYNKNLLDRYGLETPETWEDMFAAAEVLRKDDIYLYNISDKALFFVLCVYLEQTTGKVMVANDDKPELSKEDIKIMLDFYKRMYDEKVIMPLDKSTVNSFKAQKTAGVVRWVSGAENYFKDATNEDIEVIVGPYLQKADGVKACWYVKPATLYAISKTTDNPHEAGRLVDYLLNSEKMTVLQGSEKGIPISKSALNILKSKRMIPKLEENANQLIIDNQSYLEAMNPALENESIYRLFKQESDFYIYNKSSLDEVADNIYNGFNS